MYDFFDRDAVSGATVLNLWTNWYQQFEIEDLEYPTRDIPIEILFTFLNQKLLLKYCLFKPLNRKNTISLTWYPREGSERNKNAQEWNATEVGNGVGVRFEHLLFLKCHETRKNSQNRFFLLKAYVKLFWTHPHPTPL